MAKQSKKGRPNIFRYATKELSQDAMICWLIDWAGQSKGGEQEDEELRRCGLRFVSALLNHKSDDTGSIELEDEVEAEILRQDRRIDVLARIKSNNSKHVLLIEDKTITKDHGKQLTKYYDDVIAGRTQLRAVLERDLHSVYLKTGNQSLADDCHVETTTKYKVFNRLDFLNVLNRYRGRHPILLDFRRYLQDLEDETKRYTDWTRDAGRESWHAWEGFYRHLECELDNGTRHEVWWGDVSNRSGGFLGFSWWPSDVDVYLQIERYSGRQARLCFKVDARKADIEDREFLQRFWHDQILAAGGQQVVKPDVMRRGKTMTVAWWRDDWMAFGNDDKLDMSGTFENLKQAEAVLNIAVAQAAET